MAGGDEIFSLLLIDGTGVGSELLGRQIYIAMKFAKAAADELRLVRFNYWLQMLYQLRPK